MLLLGHVDGTHPALADLLEQHVRPDPGARPIGDRARIGRGPGREGRRPLVGEARGPVRRRVAGLHVGRRSVGGAGPEIEVEQRLDPGTELVVAAADAVEVGGSPRPGDCSRACTKTDFRSRVFGVISTKLPGSGTGGSRPAATTIPPDAPPARAIRVEFLLQESSRGTIRGECRTRTKTRPSPAIRRTGPRACGERPIDKSTRSAHQPKSPSPGMPGVVIQLFLLAELLGKRDNDALRPADVG